MFATLIPEHDSGLQIWQVRSTPDELAVLVATTALGASCPLCARESTRIHSRYQRTLLDLPVTSYPVRLQLRVRRFFCGSDDCPRCIFAERVPALTRPYAHRTSRMATALRHIGLALGGKAGARLAAVLQLASSPDTLLRLVRQPDEQLPAAAPRVIGIDDWAKRKGQTYGTIICDLETGAVLDLLPDREVATVAAWLEQHPSVEIISRDRAGAYAEAARLGAPAARQVADRFHVLKNLGEALEELLSRLYQELIQITAEPTAAAPVPPPESGANQQDSETALVAPHEEVAPGAAISPGDPLAPTSPPQAPRQAQQRTVELSNARRAVRLARYEEVVRRHNLGWSQQAIGKELGLSSKTIRRWLKKGGFPERQPPKARRTKLDGHQAYLQQRWAAGCHNARQLLDELRQHGYRGGQTVVREYLATLRQADEGNPEQRGSAAGQRRKPGQLARPRQLKWLLVGPVEELDHAEYETVRQLCLRNQEVLMARSLVVEFQGLVRRRQAQDLASWVERAAASGVPEMVSFARGVERDFAAVYAGLELEWSQGAVEGHVNRLKMLKRQTYGRANFDLLRIRVLYAH
jgi:transposase